MTLSFLTFWIFFSSRKAPGFWCRLSIGFKLDLMGKQIFASNIRSEEKFLRETLSPRVKTIKDMTEDEIKEIELTYKMPVNRHPKPRIIDEDLARKSRRQRF